MPVCERKLNPMAHEKVKITVHRCTCERCGYVWNADKLPLRCAKCKSPYWDKPRRVNRKEE